MPDDRSFHGRGSSFRRDDRPERGPRPGGFSPRPTTGPRPGGFTPRPPMPSEPVHSVRLREGDREVEVSGSAAFVRQALDDLPALMARLRSTTAVTSRTSIALPAAPVETPTPVPVDGPDQPAGNGTRQRATAKNGASVEERVIAVIRDAKGPIEIAEIRRRVGAEVSGQQVRRILERASDRVVSTGGRPAAYRLR